MKTEKELNEMCKCPYCGGDNKFDFNAGNGGDETNDLLYYTAVCEKCGKKVVSVYRWLGIMKVEDFNNLDSVGEGNKEDTNI